MMLFAHDPMHRKVSQSGPDHVLGAAQTCAEHQSVQEAALISEHEYPRHFRLLPRQRGRARRGWRDRRRGAGRAVHAHQARRGVPVATPSTTACARPASRRASWTSCPSTTSRCSNSTACWRPISHVRRDGLESFMMAMPLWLKRSFAPAPRNQAARSTARTQKRIVFTGAPRIARGQRVFSVAVRRGRDPHHRRRRRMGHDRRIGVGRRQQIEMLKTTPLSAFARPAVLRVHLFLRLQGQLRRIQAHGPRAVRRAEIRGPDPATICST